MNARSLIVQFRRLLFRFTVGQAGPRSKGRERRLARPPGEAMACKWLQKGHLTSASGLENLNPGGSLDVTFRRKSLTTDARAKQMFFAFQVRKTKWPIIGCRP